MTVDLQGAVEPALVKARPRPGLLVLGATDGERAAFASRGPLPQPSLAAERAVFEIGSITKVFTSLLLAVAVGRGEVDLDDPVVERLPRGTRVPMRARRPITLAHLATHTSGLPRLPPGLLRNAIRHRDDPYARLSVEDVLEALGKTRPRRPAGERFAYSNFGAGLLGIALTHTAGVDYETLVRDRITAPLGLSDTVIELDDDRRRRLAMGTKWRGGPAGLWTISGLAGAGALRSTVADLLRFVRAQMGTLPDVPPELADAIEMSHRDRAKGGRLTPGMRVALGWFVIKIGRRKLGIVMHDGGTGGYRSIAGWVPSEGVGVVALSANVRSVDRIATDLALALTGRRVAR